MSRKPSCLTGTLAVFAVLAATAVAGEPERRTRPASPRAPVGVAPPTRIPDAMPATAIPAGEPVNVASVPRVTRRAIVADAARRFDVPENAVVLTRAERVHWPDASLGCPEPGRTYAQKVVEGYRLVAKTRQGELEYHADASGQVASCGRRPPREDLRKIPPVEPVTGTPDR